MHLLSFLEIDLPQDGLAGHGENNAGVFQIQESLAFVSSPFNLTIKYGNPQVQLSILPGNRLFPVEKRMPGSLA